MKKWSNGANVEKRLHTGAQIILCCLENKRNIEIAADLNISRFRVDKISLEQLYRQMQIVQGPEEYKPLNIGRMFNHDPEQFFPCA